MGFVPVGPRWTWRGITAQPMSMQINDLDALNPDHGLDLAPGVSAPRSATSEKEPSKTAGVFGGLGLGKRGHRRAGGSAAPVAASRDRYWRAPTIHARRGNGAAATWSRRAILSSVPEVPRPVKTMARPGVVGRLDHLVVAHRAAGLDHRGGAGLRRLQQAVGEGEEGVGGDDRALGQVSAVARGLRRFGRLPGGDAGRNRRGSSGRRRRPPWRRPWRRRWRSTSRAWRRVKANSMSADLGCGRRALGDDLEVRRRRSARCRGSAPGSRRRRVCARSGPRAADRAGRRSPAGAGSSWLREHGERLRRRPRAR